MKKKKLPFVRSSSLYSSLYRLISRTGTRVPDTTWPIREERWYVGALLYGVSTNCSTQLQSENLHRRSGFTDI